VASPAASICIPTFSRLHYLQEAVASARAQTFADIEILIGDDGDSAELRAWCQSQVAADARVRYEKTPGRLGLAGNWNFLARRARGRFLNLIGDDDRLLPTFVEKLLAAAHEHTAVVFCNHFVIDGAGNRLLLETEQFARQYGRADLPAGDIADPQLYYWTQGVPMAPALVRSEDVRRLAFKEDINTPEPELFARLVGENPNLVFVPDYLMEFRIHVGSATSSGLTIDRLAEYLQDLPVPAHVEAAKRAYLAPFFLSGTSRRLTKGDVAGARALAASRYYPHSMTNPRVLIQRLALALPDSAAAMSFAALRRVRRLLAARSTAS